MSLIDQIKKRQVTARIAKNYVESSILTTLIGEAEMIGKNSGNRQSTDEEVTDVIVKFIKNIDNTLNVIPDSDERSFILKKEREILSEFLPKKLSSDEIMKVIITKFPDPTPIGQIMSFLKTNYPNQFDGKEVSMKVKSLYENN